MWPVDIPFKKSQKPQSGSSIVIEGIRVILFLLRKTPHPQMRCAFREHKKQMAE